MSKAKQVARLYYSPFISRLPKDEPQDSQLVLRSGDFFRARKKSSLTREKAAWKSLATKRTTNSNSSPFKKLELINILPARQCLFTAFPLSCSARIR